MKTNRRDHAQSQLFQLLVDAMVAFSSNPEERIRVEENCSEEAADELIGNLMERVSTSNHIQNGNSMKENSKNGVCIDL